MIDIAATLNRSYILMGHQLPVSVIFIIILFLATALIIIIRAVLKMVLMAIQYLWVLIIAAGISIFLKGQLSLDFIGSVMLLGGLFVFIINFRRLFS